MLSTIDSWPVSRFLQFFRASIVYCPLNIPCFGHLRFFFLWSWVAQQLLGLWPWILRNILLPRINLCSYWGQDRCFRDLNILNSVFKVCPWILTSRNRWWRYKFDSLFMFGMCPISFNWLPIIAARKTKYISSSSYVHTKFLIIRLLQ
jgi:hypothetical protein